MFCGFTPAGTMSSPAPKYAIKDSALRRQAPLHSTSQKVVPPNLILHSLWAYSLPEFHPDIKKGALRHPFRVDLTEVTQSLVCMRRWSRTTWNSDIFNHILNILRRRCCRTRYEVRHKEVQKHSNRTNTSRLNTKHGVST